MPHPGGVNMKDMVNSIFQKALSCSLTNNPTLKQKPARQFEVAPSTVERRANGTAVPRPRIRLQIIRFIKHERGK